MTLSTFLKERNKIQKGINVNTIELHSKRICTANIEKVDKAIRKGFLNRQSKAFW